MKKPQLIQHGFLYCEHGCGISYAVNEFFHLHELLYIFSAGLLVSGFMFVLIKLACEEFDPNWQ